MSIADLWVEIEAALGVSPVVFSSLRPPATDRDLRTWEAASGEPLPPPVRELYAGHDGTDDVGWRGFSFVGAWRMLPAAVAAKAFSGHETMTRLWKIPSVIPFARDQTGCYLTVEPSGEYSVQRFFEDTPPVARYFDSIESLMAETLNGLRGTHQKYRAVLDNTYLQWIDKEEEEDDVDY